MTNFIEFSCKRTFRWPGAKWLLPAVAVVLILTGLFVIACSQRSAQSSTQQRTESGNSQADSNNVKSISSMAGPPGNLPLRTLTDIPLTGGATRLDYQSLDSDNGRLYIAHLGSDLMTVFDVNKQTIVGDVKDLKRVHGARGSGTAPDICFGHGNK